MLTSKQRKQWRDQFPGKCPAPQLDCASSGIINNSVFPGQLAGAHSLPAEKQQVSARFAW